MLGCLVAVSYAIHFLIQVIPWSHILEETSTMLLLLYWFVVVLLAGSSRVRRCGGFHTGLNQSVIFPAPGFQTRVILFYILK